MRARDRAARYYSIVTGHMSRPSKLRANRLYTIGYEGLDIAAFVRRVRDVGVRAMVDVRELPLSRKRGFSKTSFRQQLSAAGIGYVHLPELGCPRAIRLRYRNGATWQEYTRDFLAYLSTQERTVRDLAKTAADMTSCLVCFEADYLECHRTYVARAAHAHGAPSVVHLAVTATIVDLMPPMAA